MIWKGTAFIRTHATDASREKFYFGKIRKLIFELNNRMREEWKETSMRRQWNETKFPGKGQDKRRWDCEWRVNRYRSKIITSRRNEAEGRVRNVKRGKCYSFFKTYREKLKCWLNNPNSVTMTFLRKKCKQKPKIFV